MPLLDGVATQLVQHLAHRREFGRRSLAELFPLFFRGAEQRTQLRDVEFRVLRAELEQTVVAAVDESLVKLERDVDLRWLGSLAPRVLQHLDLLLDGLVVDVAEFFADELHLTLQGVWALDQTAARHRVGDQVRQLQGLELFFGQVAQRLGQCHQAVGVGEALAPRIAARAGVAVVELGFGPLGFDTFKGTHKLRILKGFWLCEGSTAAGSGAGAVLDNSDRQCQFPTVKLSNKGRYAVRALFDIAFYNDGKPTQVKDIAERQDIPPRFLEQIFQDLKRAGLVGSKRGPSGGYNLQMPASEIRVGDILRVTEGPVALSEAETESAEPGARPGPHRRALASAREVTEDVFSDLSVRIEACLDGVCLQDMCDRAEKAGLRRPGATRYQYVI